MKLRGSKGWFSAGTAGGNRNIITAQKPVIDSVSPKSNVRWTSGAGLCRSKLLGKRTFPPGYTRIYCQRYGRIGVPRGCAWRRTRVPANKLCFSADFAYTFPEVLTMLVLVCVRRDRLGFTALSASPKLVLRCNLPSATSCFL